MIFTLSCSNKPKSNIKYPILLIPGYSSKSAVWETTGLVNYMQQRGLVYGGKLRVNNKRRIVADRILKGNIDFFSLSYSDSVQKIDFLEKELEKAIKYVKNKTRAKQIIIVAYSMGGLVSRSYLTKHVKKPFVSTLITIDTPHKGSYLADIAKTSSVLLRDKYLDFLSENMGIPIDGKAIDDLMSEENNQFLMKLNHSPHPKNINYISIIGVEKNTQSISSFFSKNFGFSTYEGDLVCSQTSQNMKNINWFQQHPPVNMGVKIIEGVNHLSVLNHYQTIFTVMNNYIVPITKNN